MLPEEQVEEIQVLESIYGEFFEQDPVNLAHLQVTVDTAVGPVIVEITMPPDYPQRQLPDLSLRCDSHRLVISDALKALKKEAEGLLGMAMIFSLLTFLQDWIAANATSRAGRGAKVKRLVVAEDEDEASAAAASSVAAEHRSTVIEEKILAAGTPVTRETFLKWRESFLKEQQQQQQQQSSSALSAGRLTGKQLFEQNKALAASDTGFGDDDGGEGVVEIDEALFANIHFSGDDDDDDGEEVVYRNDGNISD